MKASENIILWRKLFKLNHICRHICICAKIPKGNTNAQQHELNVGTHGRFAKLKWNLNARVRKISRVLLNEVFFWDDSFLMNM